MHYRENVLLQRKQPIHLNRNLKNYLVLVFFVSQRTYVYKISEIGKEKKILPISVKILFPIKVTIVSSALPEFLSSYLEAKTISYFL